MDSLPEFRKRIRLVVSQPYLTTRKDVSFSVHTPPDSIVSFSPYDDTCHEHVRNLHDKAIQSVPVTSTTHCQTTVGVPYNRWVQTDEQVDCHQLSTINVQFETETSIGHLQNNSESHLNSKFEDMAGQTSSERDKLTVKHEDDLVSETTSETPQDDIRNLKKDSNSLTLDDSNRSSPVDVLKLQTMQRKMIKRLHERRAVEASTDATEERFVRQLRRLMAERRNITDSQ